MSNFICCCGMREGTNTNNCERCLLVARINQLYEQRQQLEAENERLRAELEFYKSRCELLQVEQVRFRDPERTVLCNVLANGSVAASINAAMLLWEEAGGE